MATVEEVDRAVTLLDYGAGNVRSIRNAITRLGWSIIDVVSAADITNAKRLIFPGVGSFAAAMNNLSQKGFVPALIEYLHSGRPFFGICIGMQVLFEWSTEGETAGLGIIPGRVERFNHGLAIPHIGWNSLALYPHKGASSSSTSSNSSWFSGNTREKYYFVHSYRVLPTHENESWIATVTDYGERFISTVQKGNILATQFHPEKSSRDGLKLIETFLQASLHTTTESIRNTAQAALSAAPSCSSASPLPSLSSHSTSAYHHHVEEEKSLSCTELSKRIIACLDVRTNDAGDLVVTKGDQYDVREKPAADAAAKGSVRNLGKPVELARLYYEQGADEITFLNITSFRNEPLADLPLIQVLRETSKQVFVPLCVGGGIRDYVDSHGVVYTSLAIADEYFRSGADKISIGSDAVLAAEDYYANRQVCQGKTSIEQISRVYGAQAVVISIDPRRVYVHSPADTGHHTIRTACPCPNTGATYAWYQCTIKGGREARDLDVIQLCQAMAALGAGEILLNSMDADGQKNGYDLELIADVCAHTHLPVIASSGAGSVQHFSQVFTQTPVQAALAAGIFHRKEVPISAVKQHLLEENIPVRL